MSRKKSKSKKDTERTIMSDRQKQIEQKAHKKWLAAGQPICDGKEFWLAAEKEYEQENQSKTETQSKLVKGDELEKQVKSPEPEPLVRYVAVKGVREIAKGNNLHALVSQIIKIEEGNHNIGTSDVVIWDMGDITFPMMSVAASTCRGWLTINLKNRQYITDLFGVSFSQKEMQVLRQFFDVWKLEDGQTTSDAIKNIYEQTYVKDFKPGPNQIRLNRDEFKVFANKLLSIVNS